MHDSSTGSRTSVFPSFRNFELSEVPWWMLCCQVYARGFGWRQVHAQVRVEEVEAAQGERPRAPVYPPEPMFLGDRAIEVDRKNFERRQLAWNEQVQAMNEAHQDEVRAWELRGLQLAQRWELSPVAELKPFDSRPPEEREWVPVPVFENEVMRALKAQRVPRTVRGWKVAEYLEGHPWVDKLKTGGRWEPYTPEQLEELLQSQPCVHLPETLMVAVPGRDFLAFLNQLDRDVLVLVRCRWDREAKALVQVGAVPQTFVQPAVEIVASLALSELGTLPITKWPDAGFTEQNLQRHMVYCGWEPGQEVPVTRAQFKAFEQWISRLEVLPYWYVSPEYRSLMAVNLCWSEMREEWGGEYLWRPLLEGGSEAAPEAPAEDWQPTL